MRKQNNIWIIEDDPSCEALYRETLDALYNTIYFSRLDHFGKCLSDLNNKKLEKTTPFPSIIIADLKLEDGYFTDYIEEKGAHYFPCPYLVISAYDSLDLFRWCSKMGSLDMLIKPFNKNELIFKLEKVLSVTNNEHIMEYLHHSHIQLTPRETQILEVFLDHNKAITHQDIVNKVWKGASIHENNVNVQISRLREKLEDTPYKILHLGEKTWILDRGQII